MTALRTFLKSRYDYVLIDSRTGHGDLADICTVHLPDMVIDCFTLTNQGIYGSAMMTREIRRSFGPGHHHMAGTDADRPCSERKG